MPRSKSDVGTTVVKLRVENNVLREARALAIATKRHNVSAILRAAVKYGVNELKSTPMLVKAIEAGMLDDANWLENLEELRERVDKVRTLFRRTSFTRKGRTSEQPSAQHGGTQNPSEKGPADGGAPN